MRLRTRVLVLSIVAVLATATAVSARAARDGGWVPVKPSATSAWPSNPWIKLWTHRDHDLVQAEHVASSTFGVSESWLRSCRSTEGGYVARELLRRTLYRPLYRRGDGWNNDGSHAFGPWQFMLDRKPAPSASEWGTFKRYVHRAFAAARTHRVFVPFRFKRPDSYVGQALTAAFMFRIGQSGQWTGAGC